MRIKVGRNNGRIPAPPEIVFDKPVNAIKRSDLKKELTNLLKTWENCRLEDKTSEEIIRFFEDRNLIKGLKEK